jgi:hypothetical protein
MVAACWNSRWRPGCALFHRTMAANPLTSSCEGTWQTVRLPPPRASPCRSCRRWTRRCPAHTAPILGWSRSTSRGRAMTGSWITPADDSAFGRSQIRKTRSIIELTANLSRVPIRPDGGKVTMAENEREASGAEPRASQQGVLLAQQPRTARGRQLRRARDLRAVLPSAPLPGARGQRRQARIRQLRNVKQRRSVLAPQALKQIDIDIIIIIGKWQFGRRTQPRQLGISKPRALALPGGVDVARISKVDVARVAQVHQVAGRLSAKVNAPTR